MKSAATKTPLPTTPAEWNAAIANAPDDTQTPSPELAESFTDAAVVVHSGGFAAVRQQLAQQRQRGPQKSPTKQKITIRFSSDVLEKFRASGAGWQTRMDHALREWLETHPAT